MMGSITRASIAPTLACAALTFGCLAIGGGPAAASSAHTLRSSADLPQDAETSLLSRYQDFGFSSPEDMETYFTVKSVEIAEIPSVLSDDELRALFPPPENSQARDLGIDPISIQEWVTLGLKMWDLVVANKPVASVSTQRVSVLPAAEQDWRKMANWKGPAAQSFTVSVKNGYGMTVISHTSTLAFNYGGSLGGKGQFLANASLIPSNISVAWGFALNSSVEVGDALNTGSEENPVPGIELQLKWSMDSVLKHLEGRDVFFVKGNGSVVHTTHGVR